MNEKMFCPECGTLLKTGDAYCPECGKKLTISVSANTKGGNLIEVVPTKASAFSWTRLFTIMTNIVLAFSILGLLVCFGYALEYAGSGFAIVGIIIFVAILYSVSIAMVFSSMAHNIEKITKYILGVDAFQKRQMEELTTQFNKGEN